MKLEFSGISQSFGTQEVLKDVHFKVSDCRSLVLIGPSGGGKSSLLRIVAGLDLPKTGQILVNDKLVPQNEDKLIQYRRSVGTVFQAFNLFPHLSGLENILLPLEKVHGLSKQNALERANHYLKRFQLLDHAHKKPAQLSGGQKQRIAIVRAVSAHPQLLLLDEPTSALDPEMTSEVLRLIEELKTEGRDFVLVTHEISFAKRVADFVAFVSSGKVNDYGRVDEFFSNPAPEVKAFFDKILL